MTEVEEREAVWWPSPFGAGDEIGMLNHVDHVKRLQALALARKGRLYDLGRVLDERVPVFPGRYFRQTLVTTAHHGHTVNPIGENEVNWVTLVGVRAREPVGDVAPRRRDGAADRDPRLARRRAGGARRGDTRRRPGDHGR
jgi:hypothetical protein